MAAALAAWVHGASRLYAQEAVAGAPRVRLRAHHMVLDAATGAPLRTLEDHGDSVFGLA